MAYRVKNDKNSVLLSLMRRNAYTQHDICKMAPMNDRTLRLYIKNPSSMPLRTIISLAGLFGITPEQFLYLLLRNKSGNKDNLKEAKEHIGKWYNKEDKDKL